MFKPKQLSMFDIYADCLDSFECDKPKFLSMLADNIDIDELIPLSFRQHFRASSGRPRKHPLSGFVGALVIQRIFSIPTDSLLIVFLHYSKELREFCGFDKVPDASKFTRFKQRFLEDLRDMFDRLVDLTEPVYAEIDANLAGMSIFDTSGIEAYVTENNPKYADTLVRKLKAWKAAKGLDDSFDPYKAAYGLMPSCAEAPSRIRPDVFLGDAAFDTVDIYAKLLVDIGFDKAFIPLNSKAAPKYPDCLIDDLGRPCCPKDPSLPMKREGSKSHLRCGRPTMKWVTENGKSKRRTSCEDSCTDSPCGRMFYIYPEKDLRTFPGTDRGSEKWTETYKIRTAVERSINHFKADFLVAGRRTRNAETL
jgi:hypothetical protein